MFKLNTNCLIINLFSKITITNKISTNKLIIANFSTQANNNVSCHLINLSQIGKRKTMQFYQDLN